MAATSLAKPSEVGDFGTSVASQKQKHGEIGDCKTDMAVGQKPNRTPSKRDPIQPRK